MTISNHFVNKNKLISLIKNHPVCCSCGKQMTNRDVIHSWFEGSDVVILCNDCVFKKKLKYKPFKVKE